jgi:AcrR family transcriptional regulator
MITSARHIRLAVDVLSGAHRALSNAQQDRQDFILHAGRLAMGLYGRDSITMPEFSVALRLTVAQIRWHYTDLDNLFGAILRNHVKNIVQAIHESVPYADDPDPYRAARAAYFGFTRGALGTFNQDHQLFLRDRHLLPEDEAESINIHYGMLATKLGGEFGWKALDLLNTEGLTLADIEASMAEFNGTTDPIPAPPPPPVDDFATLDPAYKPHQLSRHIRRKIEALQRQRRKHQGK